MSREASLARFKAVVRTCTVMTMLAPEPDNPVLVRAAAEGLANPDIIAHQKLSPTETETVALLRKKLFIETLSDDLKDISRTLSIPTSARQASDLKIMMECLTSLSDGKIGLWEAIKLNSMAQMEVCKSLQLVFHDKNSDISTDAKVACIVLAGAVDVYVRKSKIGQVKERQHAPGSFGELAGPNVVAARACRSSLCAVISHADYTRCITSEERSILLHTYERIFSMLSHTDILNMTFNSELITPCCRTEIIRAGESVDGYIYIIVHGTCGVLYFPENTRALPSVWSYKHLNDGLEVTLLRQDGIFGGEAFLRDDDSYSCSVVCNPNSTLIKISAHHLSQVLPVREKTKLLNNFKARHALWLRRIEMLTKPKKLMEITATLPLDQPAEPLTVVHAFRESTRKSRRLAGSKSIHNVMTDPLSRARINLMRPHERCHLVKGSRTYRMSSSVGLQCSPIDILYDGVRELDYPASTGFFFSVSKQRPPPDTVSGKEGCRK